MPSFPNPFPGNVERKTKEDFLKYEIDKRVGKKDLQKIVGACFKRHGASCAADVLDKVKALGFKYSTVGAITTSVFDRHMPKDKPAILKEAEEHVLKVENLLGFVQCTNTCVWCLSPISSLMQI